MLQFVDNCRKSLKEDKKNFIKKTFKAACDVKDCDRCKYLKRD